MELVSGENVIDSIISAQSVTADLIVQYVRAMESASGLKIKTLHHLVDGAVEALEFGVPDNTPLTGTQLKNLKLKSGILLAGIVRQNGQIIIPSGSDVIQPGDDLIVVTSGPRFQDVGDILENK